MDIFNSIENYARKNKSIFEGVKAFLASSIFIAFFLTRIEDSRLVSLILVMVYSFCCFVDKSLKINRCIGMSILFVIPIVVIWIKYFDHNLTWIVFTWVIIIITSVKVESTKFSRDIIKISLLSYWFIFILFFNLFVETGCRAPICGISLSKNQSGAMMVFLALFLALDIWRGEVRAVPVSIYLIMLGFMMFMCHASGARSSLLGVSVASLAIIYKVLVGGHPFLFKYGLIFTLSALGLALLFVHDGLLWLLDNQFKGVYSDLILRIELATLRDFAVFGFGDDTFQKAVQSYGRVPHNTISSYLLVYGLFAPYFLFLFLRFDVVSYSSAFLILGILFPSLMFSSIGKYFVVSLLIPYFASTDE